MNKKLFELYNDHWNSLYGELENINSNSEFSIKPANPLMLKVGDEVAYANSDLKVMIFGQEPNTWGEHLRDNITEIQFIYEDFFLSEYCYDIYKKPFWNGVNQLRQLFRKQYPNKKIEFYWNDVIKIGISDNKGMPPKYIQDIELKKFKVIAEEIGILKPDVLIFLSGPNYDWFIKQQLGEISFNPIEGYSVRQMSKLNIPYSKVALRTYHPGYLKRSSKTETYFNSVIHAIRNSL